MAVMVSLMVFHSPQSLHCPAHFDWLAPQALQVYWIFALAIFITTHIAPKICHYRS
jgi:hypothetical protein